MTDPRLATYIKQVNAELHHAEAREHAYRPALKGLLESLGDFHAINDAAHIKDVGAPDFIMKRDQLQVAYVEAKDIGEDLDAVEKSEQIRERYLPALPNFVLTDYVEFRWYYQGQKRLTAKLGDVQKNRLHTSDVGTNAVMALLTQFAQASVPRVGDAEELARVMAGMTRHIRDLIRTSLDREGPTPLRGQKAAFEQMLIPNLDNLQFADMYAQTLAYGLFAARTQYIPNRDKPFTLENAFWNLPKTNPFLTKFFQSIAPDLDERVRWQVDALAELLAVSDMDTILEGFGKLTRQEDPVVHFYETFLAAYDASMRERRGVYYTPEPVVSYIVRSVDHILREAFGRADGLAADDVYVLDPATGTGTFLYYVIQQIFERVVEEQGQRGMWPTYVQHNLLKRIFGFELLMAPYAVAHMKLGLQLRELLKQTGFKGSFEQRLGVYLTNTLEELNPENQPPLPMAGFIAEEGQQASAIKREKPIMVVLGNPPYSGHSSNTGAWISELVRDYYVIDGQPLGERNPKWLQDDYVKFIRFGQWRIEQTGSGVLAFVTNHSYLDSPTFRGMRQQLMQTFSDIYVLNLHGNSKKKEAAPDGGKDENVFDIQQGVAVVVMVKQPHPPYVARRSQMARVWSADAWGGRKVKYATLQGADLGSTDWTALAPSSPFYLFVPQNTDLRGEYEAWPRIPDVMGVNVLGFQTHRDHFAVAFDRETMQRRLRDMREMALSDEAFGNQYNVKSSTEWQIHEARARLRQIANWEADIIDGLYRPFDWRPCYFSEVAMDRPRRELVNHVAGKGNLCLLSSRQQGVAGYRHVWMATAPANDCVVSNRTREANQVFPLYLYPDAQAATLFDVGNAEGWPLSAKGRYPNLSRAFVQDFAERLGLTFITEGQGDGQRTFGPEDIFYYAYAVFHSPTYRERYAEFLKIDFPRLPLTRNVALFHVLVDYGARLVKLHLLDSGVVAKLITRYPEANGNRVDKVHYDEPHQRVYINKTQYFEGVPAEVWAFYVGGYQVCEKWLKDRKGRTLSAADIMHYQRIVVALAETIKTMQQIDEAIPAWPIE